MDNRLEDIECLVVCAICTVWLAALPDAAFWFTGRVLHVTTSCPMRRLSQSLQDMMSSSRGVEGEPTMADLIESGRRSYEAKRYKRALEQFTRVSVSAVPGQFEAPWLTCIKGHEKLSLR